MASEIDGLRRAVGDGSLARIPAHITLVPPVNVALERLEEASDVLRSAASGFAPLELALGPAVTFWPATPVVYLEVGGDVPALRALRDAVFRAPLARTLTYDFVPHVTLADDVASPERIGQAVAALADYRRTVRIERVHILREGAGRVWEPIVDADLSAPAVVGRGGLPVELARSTVAGPVALERVGRAAPVVVTARREGAVVGVVEARPDPATGAALLVELTVSEVERDMGVGTALVAELSSVLAELGVDALIAYVPAEAAALGEFLLGRGFHEAEPGRLIRRL